MFTPFVVATNMLVCMHHVVELSGTDNRRRTHCYYSELCHPENICVWFTNVFGVHMQAVNDKITDTLSTGDQGKTCLDSDAIILHGMHTAI